MDLSALLSSLTIWSIFGVVTMFAIPLEWYDAIFHDSKARRVVAVLFLGPLVWLAIWMIRVCERWDVFEDHEI